MIYSDRRPKGVAIWVNASLKVAVYGIDSPLRSSSHHKTPGVRKTRICLFRQFLRLNPVARSRKCCQRSPPPISCYLPEVTKYGRTSTEFPIDVQSTPQGALQHALQVTLARTRDHRSAQTCDPRFRMPPRATESKN